MASNDHCSECGMANVADEFHPHALCLLVKARGGDTAAARSDMAFVLRAAQSPEAFTQQRISTFLVRQTREKLSRRGR